MKLRGALILLVAVAGVSGQTAGDTYSMTYQTTATARVERMSILSFAIARRVTPGQTGGPSQQRQPNQGQVMNAGEIQFKTGSQGAALGSTFKVGRAFEKLSITLWGTAPGGKKVVDRTWKLTGAKVGQYSVAGTGGNATATVGLTWTAISLS